MVMRMTMTGRWIPVVLIGLGAFLSASPQAVANAADGKGTSAPAAAQDQAEKKAPEDERDYYTLRAKKMLEQDKADVTAKPHPLTTNYPEQYVTICEGGCKNRRAHIVDFEPRKPHQAAEVGEVIPTAAGRGPAAKSNVVECIGGCLHGNSVFLGTDDYASMDENWDTTVDAASSRGESGRWMSDRN